MRSFLVAVALALEPVPGPANLTPLWEVSAGAYQSDRSLDPKLGVQLALRRGWGPIQFGVGWRPQLRDLEGELSLCKAQRLGACASMGIGYSGTWLEPNSALFESSTWLERRRYFGYLGGRAYYQTTPTLCVWGEGRLLVADDSTSSLYPYFESSLVLLGLSWTWKGSAAEDARFKPGELPI
ncbi:MAG: hypothetical protein ACI9VR_000046 [Cognaticolwellia sp.]|jgi:hypothetical protein